VATAPHRRFFLTGGPAPQGTRGAYTIDPGVWIAGPPVHNSDFERKPIQQGEAVLAEAGNAGKHENDRLGASKGTEQHRPARSLWMSDECLGSGTTARRRAPPPSKVLDEIFHPLVFMLTFL